MRRIVSRSLLAGLAALAGSTVANANDVIDHRQAQQQRQIQEGVRNGSITRGEYARLQQEQARIAEMERRAKADGRVDRYEAWQINRAQDAAARHIYEESNDRDRRGRHGGHGGWGWRRWW